VHSRSVSTYITNHWDGRLVDDATNTTLARLGQEETIWAAAGVLRAWIERYGVPLKLYVDWKNLYKRSANAQEGLRGEELSALTKIGPPLLIRFDPP
jgi:hypothetical protein